MPVISDADLAWMNDYISSVRWKEAKSGPNHSYTVREWEPNRDEDFVRFVRLIRSYGSPENFYTKVYIYFYLGGLKYWTMGSPIDETVIINRAPENTFYGKRHRFQLTTAYDETVYDTLASLYDKRYSSLDCLEEDRIVFGFLREKAQGSILDVGCGTGLAVDHLTPRRYLGIEPSQGMFNEFIRKHPDYPIQQSTFEDYPSGLIFDNVISLYGSCSYIKPSEYERLRDSGTLHFLMFYKEGYLPDYYAPGSGPVTDYDLIRNVFPSTHVFKNYLVATNMMGSHENL